jgi:sirohydrochlorin cobaltochelatase
VLAVAEDRIRTAVGDGDPARTAVVLVSRGSSDPDANADLYKVARLLWDSRGLAMVEPAFVSLAEPGVPAALERCRLLGATRIVVVPYFLFTGVLVDRIEDQVAAWAAAHPEVDARPGPHLGADPRIAGLVLERYREAVAGGAHMNCDLCVYRHALPGYEQKHHHAEEVISLGEHNHH